MARLELENPRQLQWIFAQHLFDAVDDPADFPNAADDARLRIEFAKHRQLAGADPVGVENDALVGVIGIIGVEDPFQHQALLRLAGAQSRFGCQSGQWSSAARSLHRAVSIHIRPAAMSAGSRPPSRSRGSAFTARLP
jgi:hypothetical protein